MNFFKRLPATRSEPPGLERRILRLMPRVFLVGSLLPVVLAVLLRQWPWNGDSADVEAMIGRFDFMLIGLLLLHWTLVAVVTIGAVVVVIMKGPGYVADAYRVPDAERPGDVTRYTDDPEAAGRRRE